MDDPSLVRANIEASIALKKKLLEDKQTLLSVVTIVDEITSAYRKNKKVLFCGNGGSAADAQHLAAELTGRYYYDRPPLSAEALHVNTSYLTAVANDYSYEEVYARMVRGIAHNGDILIGLSTSGNSTNVLKALIEAKKIGCITVGFTGKGGGKMKEHCDYLIAIDSKDTPRIQECHMLIGHAICQLIEQKLFPQK
jgi:D-sedoheptulose 7-phosphate isomerase